MTSVRSLSDVLADPSAVAPARSNGSEITGADTEGGSGQETAALEELDEEVLRSVTGRGTAIAESLERLDQVSEIENRGSSARSAGYPTEGGS